MLWLIVGLVVVVGIGFGAALAINSKNEQRKALDIVPGVSSSAPKAWAGSHSTEAKLHRRIGVAVAAAHAQVAIAGASLVGRVSSLDAAATILDQRLIAAAALPAAHRDGAIADIGGLVERFETAIANLAVDGAASDELDAAFDQAMGDIEAELTALAQARAEVERIDRGTPPPA